MIATDGLDLFDSLGRLADLAGEANDLREVLDRAVLMVAETTDADLCLIVESPTATSNVAPVLAQSRFDADAIGTSELTSWVAPIARRVSGTNRPLLLQTADASDGELRAMLSAGGFASAVAAPVPAEGQSPLVLVAFSVTPNGFANADLGFVSSMSSILALARRLSDGDHEVSPEPVAGSDLARAQRMAGLGGWELDLTAGALQWSDAAYELFGLSKQDTAPTQELFDSLVDTRDSERLRSSLRETRLSGVPGVIEYRITRTDGSSRWLRQEHELIEGGSESPRMIGTIHDVTLQRETADALRHNDERLRAVLNVSAIGIAIVENDGRTVYRNRAYTDLLGYSNQEMEQRTLEEVATAADRSRISDLRAHLAQGETHVELDSPAGFVRKDGTITYLDVSVTRAGAGKDTVRVVNLRDRSEQVTAELQIAEGEERFRKIFDTASSGLLILGTDGRPETANLSFREIFGVTSDDIRERSPQEFIVSEQQRSDVTECIEEHLRGESGSCAHVLDIRRLSDDAPKTVSVTCQTLMNEGEVRGVLAEFTDLTEALDTQRALQASERRLREAGEVVRLGHWEWDVSAGEITASELIAPLFDGITRSDLFYERYMGLVAPEDRDRVKAASEIAFGGGESFDLQYTVHPRDSEPMVLHEVVQIEFDEHGETIRALGIVQDITDRVTAERASAESESRLRAIFDASHNGISFFSDRRMPPFRNRAFAEMLGYTLEETRNLSLGALLPLDEDRDWIDQLWERVGQGEPAGDLGLKRFVHKDGHIIDVDIRLSDVVVDENVIGHVADVRDVTSELAQRRALEESESRARLIFETTSSGSLLMRLNGDIQIANQAFCDILGTTIDNVSTLKVHRIIDRQDVKSVFDFFRARLRGDLTNPRDISVRLKRLDDGRMRTLRVDVRPFIEDGEIAGMLADVRDVTEHTETIHTLEKSQARLARAQANARIGGWELDAVTNELRWSDELYRLMGQQPAETPLTIGDLLHGVHQDDRARFIETFEQAQQTSSPFDIRLRFAGGDGQPRIVWSRGDLIVDEAGEPLRWEGTTQDITELAEAQQALTEGAARLELAQSQAHVGSFGRNLMTGEVYWSDELYRLLGHEPHAIEPSIENMFAALHPDDRDRFREATRDAVRTGIDRYDLQSRFIRPDDEQRVFWQHGELTRDEAGQPLRWDGTAQDVTELVDAQHALTEREEFLRTTLDAVRSGVMVVDPARQIISANGNASEIMGYSADEFLTVHLEDVVHGEDLALMLTRFAARVRGEGGPERTIVRAWKQDGSEVNLDVRGAPLLQSGELRGVVVDFRDVTEELAVQQRLEDTANRLRTLIEAVRSGLMVIGPNMVPITCNEAIAEMLGTSSDELLSQSIDVFLLPEERQIVAEAIEARMRNEAVPGRIPSAVIRADGVQREVDVRTTPFIVAGETIGILCEVRDITDDLALQREVQETAERLNNVFETVSTGLIVVGLDQRPLTVNQALCDILNYSRDELMQKTFAEISHPDDAQFLLERFAQRMGGGSSENRHQSRALRSDGSVIHVDISAEPFRIGGEIVGVLGEVRDITEALALQQEVEHTAERLNTVFESVSTGLAIVGPDRRPVTVNQALCDITGYSREELLAGPFELSLHPEDVEGVLQRFEDRLSGEMDQRNESQTRLIRKDGRTADISIGSEPFHIGGRFVGILAEIRDITQELSLQQQVQETANRLNSVFESVSTGLLVIGPDRHPLTVNQALCEITGYPRETLLSTPIDDLIHHDDLPAVLDRFAKRLAGDVQPYHLQARTIRFDGEVITIDLSAEPFLVGGEVVGVLAEIRDITEDLELQDRVQETADRLNNVFASVSTGLAVVGADRRPQTMNQAFCDIVGLPEAQLAEKSFDSLIHPDDLEIILERFERRLVGEDVVPHHIHVRVIRGNGELIDIDLSARPFVIGGKITGVLAEIRDITEELSLQTLVAESAEQINTILEATPDAIVVADDHDMILRVNAATERIFDTKTDELIGHPVSELVGGIDQAAHHSYVE
ncbi:MAG: PAS domain S-box protein, partial [Dehalococcoidia bacterium]|nr:PAS domain S-box protein [Dehalococcoidia bacterium]